MNTLMTLVVPAAILLSTAPAIATHWYVDDDAAPGGNGTSPATPFATIQAAIDASADGDTIFVSAGAYGPIDLDGRAVHLYGADGRDATWISGGAPSVRCNSGEGPDTVIEAFTITGGAPGLHAVGADPTILDCRFTANEYEVGGAARLENSDASFVGCLFDDNDAAVGAGIRIFGGAVTLTDCVFDGNRAFGSTGAVVAGNGAYIEMVGCTITDHNMPNNGQGAVLVAGGSTGLLVNCLFARNGPHFSSGGVVAVMSQLTMVNCALSRNHGSAIVGGGGILVATATALLVNCTIAGNESGGLAIESSQASAVELRNCIVWGNQGASIVGSATVSHSNVEGGWPGTGNIDIEPKFVQPGTDDLRLSFTSRCLDAGDDALVAADQADVDGDGDTGEPIPLDLDGQPRFQGVAVDLGPLEGAYAPLPPAWLVSDLDPGEAEFLTPLGGPFAPSSEMVTIMVNIDGAENGTATATFIARTESAGDGGAYLPIADRQHVETDLADGTYRSTIFLPFTAGDLGGASPFQVELARLDDASGAWRFAALEQTVEPGDRVHVTGPGPLGTTPITGDWGVWWDPTAQLGFAWINADVGGTYAAALPACSADCDPLGGDGLIDVHDLVRVVLAWGQGTISGCDVDGSGAVDPNDILAVIDVWGACE